MPKQPEKLDNLALYLACKEAKEQNEFLAEDQAKAFIANLPQFSKRFVKKSP